MVIIPGTYINNKLTPLLVLLYSKECTYDRPHHTVLNPNVILLFSCTTRVPGTYGGCRIRYLEDNELTSLPEGTFSGTGGSLIYL